MADTQITKSEPTQIVSVDESAYSAFLDTATFNQTWRAATLLSKSDLVPTHYKGKPENCFIAFTAARRVNADPFVFMQKTYVIGGKLGMESQYMIALVNTTGPFTGPIQWRLDKQGDKIISCTAYATHKQTGEVCEATVSAKMVDAEGWAKKSGSKWVSLPELMFKYRSAAFLARLYCPEVLFGMRPADELDDINDQPRPEKTLPVSDLNARLSKKVESVSVESEPSVSVEPDIDAEIAAAKDADEEVWPDDAQDAPKSSITPAPEPQAAQGIDPSERYYCNKCGKVFPAPTGAKKNLCRHCLSEDIVDRMKQE